MVTDGAVNRQISGFVERMSRESGENLVSVVLYGSATTGNFVEKRSDVNLLCVFNRLGEPELNAVSRVVQWWAQELQMRPPMVLTLEELQESADVFAIETLDIKSQNKLLFGRDVLSTLDVPMNLHRVQVEHELRILVLRLRQHLLLAHGKRDDLEKALARSASSATTLLRHALIVVEGRSTAGGRQVLPRATEVLGVNLSTINAVLDLHDGKRVQSDLEETYRDYIDLLQTVVEKVDQALPKKQIQKVG